MAYFHFNAFYLLIYFYFVFRFPGVVLRWAVSESVAKTGCFNGAYGMQAIKLESKHSYFDCS